MNTVCVCALNLGFIMLKPLHLIMMYGNTYRIRLYVTNTDYIGKKVDHPNTSDHICWGYSCIVISAFGVVLFSYVLFVLGVNLVTVVTLALYEVVSPGLTH